MYSLQCKVYTVHCTVYSVQCTVLSVQCTVYCVQYAVCSVQCTVNSQVYTDGQYTLQEFTIYSVECAVCSDKCAVRSVQCSLEVRQCLALLPFFPRSHQLQFTFELHCRRSGNIWKKYFGTRDNKTTPTSILTYT